MVLPLIVILCGWEIHPSISTSARGFRIFQRAAIDSLITACYRRSISGMARYNCSTMALTSECSSLTRASIYDEQVVFEPQGGW